MIKNNIIYHEMDSCNCVVRLLDKDYCEYNLDVPVITHSYDNCVMFRNCNGVLEWTRKFSHIQFLD